MRCGVSLFFFHGGFPWRAALLVRAEKKIALRAGNDRACASSARGYAEVLPKRLFPDNLVAVEAVIGEPVSACIFPCYVGKYREFSRIDLQIGRGAPFSDM
jgi:hypothetical protein